MALSKNDRISISKKIIDIPKQNKQADLTIDKLNIEKQKAQQEDDANKNLADPVTVLINLYQAELENYTGNGHTQLTEQSILDSADKKFQNAFFPNDSQTALPDISGGIWKFFQAFSGGFAVGKNYLQAYLGVQSEQSIINDINAKVGVVESFSDVTRSTGQKCTSGVCSLPAYDNSSDCTANGGTWTPGIDNIVTDIDMHTAGTDLINAIQSWENFINATYSNIPTAVEDSDTTRSTENDSSRADITNSLSIINTWQGRNDYDTTHGTTTCIAFNSLDVSTLNPTKFRAAELQAIKDEIVARQTFISTRISQIDGYLGTVSQNFSTGEIVSANGFYGKRFRVLENRLNIIGGSLSKLRGFERGQDAQTQIKNANANTLASYTDFILATAFRAPATGNKIVHVLDSTGFSVSDNIYIVANDQPEISTISSINGNTITLSDVVPKTYKQDLGARLYKIL